MTDYFDLGSHARAVTTAVADAQMWFDRGLNWIYGYNQDEAIRCFGHAIAADPDCAMAHWGLAYAHGPYLNKEWRFYSPSELDELIPLVWRTARRAVRLSSNCMPVEQALCAALVRRYWTNEVSDLTTMAKWTDDFATAMGEVYKQFPGDRDVTAVYAEAMMMRTPWRLWDLDTGEPALGADTLRIIEVLESGFRLSEEQDLKTHPGIAHMMCHAVEMSPTPESGLRAADQLRDLAPALAHLSHMPGHIDVLCGRYSEAVAASAKAIAADKAYLAQVGPYGQYTAAICHDNHLMMFASMLLGRWDTTIEAADLICEIVTDDVLVRSTPSFQITLEAYYSMRIHAFVRFGKWAQILEQPLPADPELYPVTTAMHRYAGAVAHASMGDNDGAQAEALAFDAAVARITPDRHLFNNTSHTVLAVASAMMRGEISYHGGDHQVGFDHLRRAVQLNDKLNYTEPWAWMHPPRHALGALLLAQGEVDEAIDVYRADLGLAGNVPRSNVHPDNVWALHGYVECLERLDQVDEVEPWRRKLDSALSQTDSPVTSSCACRIEG